MSQILVLSGKGGTGKTTVASAFIKLSKARTYADCDVDAPNLHLAMGSFEQEKTKDYFGLPKARIDPELCIGCNRCFEVCRFDAVMVKGGAFVIKTLSCEGCRYCIHVCPAQAIHTEEANVGLLKLLSKNDEHFSTATLTIGSGTTGKLVTEVKRQLKSVAKREGLTIIDGSPGIGCPVIASLSGVDLALMVTEPSVSGISDLKRVLQSAKQLQVSSVVVVNRYDTNLEKTQEIEAFCKEQSIPFLGTIPYDPIVIKAVNESSVITNYASPASKALKSIYERMIQFLEEEGR